MALWVIGVSVAAWAEGPGFRLLSAEATGLFFTNVLSEADGAANRVLENGSGVAVGDVDGDGVPDLFLCGLAGNSALYRNLGNLRFTNVTRNSGLRVGGEMCRGAVIADVNGDRRNDLLVSTHAKGVWCFLNEGEGRFRDATMEAGTGGRPGSTTLALADVDANGTLDLYVTRYRADDIRDNSNVEARIVNGRMEFHPKYEGRLFNGPRGVLEHGESDSLYLNDGNGRFREVSWTGGAFLDQDGERLAAPPRDWGLSASFRDVNGDGRPDLYVCNDYWTPDRLWLNQGGGVFRAAPRGTFHSMSENSMGVDFADIDRDGDTDFLVVDMLSRDRALRRRQSLAQTLEPPIPEFGSGVQQVMRNSLYENRGDGTYAQVADIAGLSASDWSWQPLFLDVDLDGYEDVLISAGHRRDVQDLDATEKIRTLQRPLPSASDPVVRQRAFARNLLEHSQLYPPLMSSVHAFRSERGRRFVETDAAWGFDVASVHQGMASGDLDGDGDLDLVVSRLNDSVAVYRNEAGAGRVSIRLRGVGRNTAGIGAEVRVRSDAMPMQSQEVVAGGRYLSGGDTLLVFAAGESKRVEVDVRWPGRERRRYLGLDSGRVHELSEAAGVVISGESVTKAGESGAWFEEVTSRLGREPGGSTSKPTGATSVTRRGATPTIAWFDLNRDGWPDLMVGGGAGTGPKVFTNDTRGGFAVVSLTGMDRSTDTEVTSVAGFTDSKGRVRFLTGFSGLEPMAEKRSSVFDRLWAEPGKRVMLPGWGVNVGGLVLADVDKDGDDDLFVPGAEIAGRYPEPASSRLYFQEDGGWREDAKARETFQRVGLVRGAAWGDWDGDGDPDLVLAREWGSLGLYRNEAGRLVEVVDASGMEGMQGLWSAVAAGDLDGDGRPDWVAGNSGLNTFREASSERPLVLFHGDFLNRQTVDVLETEWDPVRGTLAPRQSMERMASALPLVRSLFPSHRKFSEATAEEVLRSFPGRGTRRLEAVTLESAVFLNRGGWRFERVPLPRAAQLAPVRSIAVADFDADGHADLFLSQNRWRVGGGDPEESAGVGLLLRGVGGGRFVEIPAVTSGIRLEGEQGGAAGVDFDRDGRVDLAIGAPSGEVRLFRNRGMSNR